MAQRLTQGEMFFRIYKTAMDNSCVHLSYVLYQLLELGFINVFCCSMGSLRFEAQPPPNHQQVRSYRNWNPPLLGNLPEDFLRILPQQLNNTKVYMSAFRCLIKLMVS